MAKEQEASEEETNEIRELVERIAKRLGKENPRCMGYILAFDYLDGDANPTWGLRCDPDMNFDGHSRLATLVDLDNTKFASHFFGYEEAE